MGIISIENTDKLYWLGRYSERVYTTTKLFSKHYDDMIDLDLNSYEKFCNELEIPNIYESKEDFCTKYCNDATNPDSIYSNLKRCYDNAIVLRELIGSAALSYIQLATYDMVGISQSQSPLVELQKIIDNILAFWGIVDDYIEDSNVRDIIKTGKRIERLDLYARLKMPKNEIQREVHRLSERIPRTNLKYSVEKLNSLKNMAKEEKIDYYSMVREVDSLLEE